VLVNAILDPNAGPPENKWGPVIHPVLDTYDLGLASKLGFKGINGRDAIIISIDRTTRTVVFDIGAGRTITKVIPPGMLMVMEERVHPAGRDSSAKYHTGGTLGDLEEGDRVAILIDPENPKNEFWALLFVQ